MGANARLTADIDMSGVTSDKPYAIVGTETFWGTEKSFTPSSVINSVVAQDATDMESVPITYYTLDGIQLSAPQKGFNLIKMSDGQVKKVWVK